MGTTNVQNAAQSASSQVGLPSDVLAAMIQLEGPSQSAPNNPFDVTQTWANLTGFGQWVSSLFNSVGVASFSNEAAAISAWAQGLLTFSNYTGVRKVMASPTSTVHDFYDALSKTGYAGGSASYGASLDSTYQSMTGKDPITTLLSGSGVTLPTLTGKPSPILTPVVAGIIPAPVTQTFTTIENALSSLADSVATGANNLTTGIGDLRSIADFLQTPALWTRLVVGLLGGILLVVGLILFGASFVPKGTKLPIPVPA